MGANAFDAGAVAGVFRVKGRPLDNPVIVHVGGIEQVSIVARTLPGAARRLIDEYWPGPLTLVLRKRGTVPDAVSGGLDTVSVRMPDSSVALSLISAAGTPIAAPSANLSGRPSITSFLEAVRELDGKVDMIIDGGSSRIGLESTVVDMTGRVPVILRPGGVTPAMVERVAGHVRVHPAALGTEEFAGQAPSPGMKYRHYAPEHAIVVLFEKRQGIEWAMAAMRDELLAEGKTVALMVTDENRISGRNTKRIGSRHSPGRIGRALFSTLRELDRRGFDFILAEGISEKGVGLAVMNRLRRASSTVICPEDSPAGEPALRGIRQGRRRRRSPPVR